MGVAQLVANWDQASADLAAHEEAKPEPLDFPTDDELAEWERERTHLAVQKEEVRKQVQNADYNKEQTRKAAIAAAKRLEHQQQVVTTLQNKVADPENFGRGWVGGLSRI